MDMLVEIEKKVKSNSKFSNREISLLKELHSTGFPNTKNEEWKYISFEKVLQNSFDLEGNSNSKLSISTELIPNVEVYKLIFVNGKFNVELSTKLASQDGFTLSQESNIESNSYREYNKDGFIVLNEVFNPTSFKINILKGEIISKPIAIYHIHSSVDLNSISFPNITIEIEENAQASFLEVYASEKPVIAFSNSILNFNIQKNALVEYYKLFNCNENSHHVGTTQVNQLGKSIFHATTINLSGGLIRNNLNIAIHSEYSDSKIYGLNFLSGETTVDNHTVVDHKVANCESTELYKSALDDDATAIFNGKIYVRADAQKTNAYQSSKNILLSNSATANSKPQLEIWADDVKCSHGHATGQLDKDALFYLKARGIGDKEAKAMLTQAFVQDVLNTIKIEPLKAYCEQLVSQRFAS
jgi:Fe-S cluster assembly protein SufD